MGGSGKLVRSCFPARGGTAVLVVIALASACSTNSSASTTDNASTTPSTTSFSTTTVIGTTANPATTLVRRRWLEYWRFVESVVTTSSPFDPRMREYMTGPAFTGLQNVLKERSRAGVTVRFSNGHDTHLPRVVDVTRSDATVRDCWEDRAVQVDRAGKVLDGSINTLLLQGTMIRSDGKWKTFRYQILRKWKVQLEESGCRA